ncbi:hypothetical protein J2847_000954 [Azospirillum agricola]|uniref:formylglycine-generating enzyme family protein n=1 Tax=Azospirillum agricola TaxID=1720247 RepID=UPI001AE3A830|nr:SUMF1/EgtB/PvdO family nonheme iron enzyme [Azospirillum agricola]MBP2227672.1 hypothetical protein [Azospirillum agricola]
MPDQNDANAPDAERVIDLYRSAIATARAARREGALRPGEAPDAAFAWTSPASRIAQDAPARPAPRPRRRFPSPWRALAGGLVTGASSRRARVNMAATAVVAVAVVAAALLIFGRFDETPLRPLPAGAFADCAACPPLRTIDVPPDRAAPPKAPFAIGVYEVTVGEWRSCVAAGRCSAVPLDLSDLGSDRAPVAGVTIAEVDDYLRYLTDTTCRPYRLPSDAEWEYAARARTAKGALVSWQTGDAPPRREDYCAQANLADQTFDGEVSFSTDRAELRAAFAARVPRDGFTVLDCAESPARCRHDTGRYLVTERILPAAPDQRRPGLLPCTDGHASVAPVGSFPANGFGLHDVIGNVWEITRVPRLDASCGLHALRGGSYINAGRSVDLAYRACGVDLAADSSRRPYVGFRVVREPAFGNDTPRCPSGQHHVTENVD